MTNDMRIETSPSSRVDSPRLDLASLDGAANMLSRLKSSNQALAKLRRALESDERDERRAVDARNEALG